MDSQAAHHPTNGEIFDLFAKANLSRILGNLSIDDVVLDIGGWAQPLNRANRVIDAMPYETRGAFGSLGEGPEMFSKETWICRDLCAREPFPFGNKEIDYVFCSHTLEDLRDPIFVCSEIIRVGKRGYIEVPSWLAECGLGVESRSYAGWYHHRWIVEIRENELTFVHKPHSLHSQWSLHVPRKVTGSLKVEDLASYLFWKDDFAFREKILIDEGDLVKELEARIRSVNVHPLRFEMRDRSRWIRDVLSKSKFLSKLHRELSKTWIGRI